MILCGKVLVIGDVMIDLLIKYDKDYVPNGAAFYEGNISFGGVGNIATFTALLGIKVAMVGVIGNDTLGQEYLKDLRKYKVIPFIFQRKLPTGFVISLINKNGDRSFLVCRGANNLLSEKDVEEALIKFKPEIVFVSGYGIPTTQRNALIYSVKRAKELGATVVYDPASYNIVKCHRKLIINTILKDVDVFLPNFEEARAIVGNGNIKEIQKKLPKLVNISIIKMGEKGALLLRSSNSNMYSQLKCIPGFTVPAIDTTGAGDTFAAGVLYSLSKKIEIEKGIQLGCWLASHTVKNYGTRYFPEKEQISSYLKNLLITEFKCDKR